MTTTILRKTFQRCLETQGYCSPPGRSACALASAKTILEWNDAERAGMVRMRAEPQQESYFDVYGDPEGGKQERKKIEEMIENQGCWIVVTEVNTSTGWEYADSIGMIIANNPTSPFENTYAVDLMRSALDKIEQPGDH